MIPFITVQSHTFSGVFPLGNVARRTFLVVPGGPLLLLCFAAISVFFFPAWLRTVWYFSGDSG